MAQLPLHHINFIVTDLPRSLAFYQKLFGGLTVMERPPFKSVGAWLACGTLQVHLTVYPPGSFRTGNIDNDDYHFAFRTDDFDGALATLTASGFREDAAEDDPMRVMVRRNSLPVSPSSTSSIPTGTSSRSTARRSQLRLTPVERASLPMRTSTASRSQPQ
jgi:catechol 2,3-dioxygenase-like lactoylglutathione lyase family enzyme